MKPESDKAKISMVDFSSMIVVYIITVSYEVRKFEEWDEEVPNVKFTKKIFRFIRSKKIVCFH